MRVPLVRLTGTLKSLSLLLCGVVLVLTAGCQTSQGGIQVSPSPKIQAFLGDEIIAVVSAPDRIEPFLLEAAFMPDPSLTGPTAIGGYTWKARGADLPAVDIQWLSNLIMSQSSYDFEIAKKCPFVPEVALRFHRGTDHVDVMVSQSCAMWQFEKGDAAKLEDFDPIKDQMKAIISSVFKID